VSPLRSWIMTSLPIPTAWPSPTASMTRFAMRGLLALGQAGTLPNLPWTRFPDGGSRLAENTIPTPGCSSSLPTAEAVTGIVPDCGSSPSSTPSVTASESRSRSVIILRVPPSGIRSNTECSLLLARTGLRNHWWTTKPS